MSLKLECPRCGAKDDKAALQVISGVFRTRGVYLSEAGFWLGDAKHCDTENEAVQCGNCKQIFLLADLANEP